MSIPGPVFTGLTPYLHYSKLADMIAWLTRVFGFVEKGRWQDESGVDSNAELIAGTSEIWLDGAPDWWSKKGRQPEEWIGVWVSDVDAMYARVIHQGVAAQRPEHKFYGVRVLQVKDPEGYTWGFMQRAPVLARAPKMP